jgi:hypothetical protein
LIEGAYEKGQTGGLAFVSQRSRNPARRVGDSMRGGECDSFADLTDCPIDQLDGAFAVAAFVGNRCFEFGASVCQKRKRRVHTRLRAQGISNAQAGCDQDANQQLLV